MVVVGRGGTTRTTAPGIEAGTAETRRVISIEEGDGGFVHERLTPGADAK
jgi:hypothetical protein